MQRTGQVTRSARCFSKSTKHRCCKLRAIAGGKAMPFTLSQIGQVSLTVDDLDEAERFYGDILGIRKLFRFGDLSFFDCSGLRIFIEKSNVTPFKPESSVLYFRTPDIGLAFQQLTARGVSFIDTPHL